MLIARGVTETQRSFHGWRARPAGSTVATYGLRLFFRIVVKLATSRSNGTQLHTEGCNEIKK